MAPVCSPLCLADESEHAFICTVSNDRGHQSCKLGSRDLNQPVRIITQGLGDTGLFIMLFADERACFHFYSCQWPGHQSCYWGSRDLNQHVHIKTERLGGTSLFTIVFGWRVDMLSFVQLAMTGVTKATIKEAVTRIQPVHIITQGLGDTSLFTMLFGWRVDMLSVV